MLDSNGNGEFYEDKLSCHEFKHILSKVKSNAIVFNYPGVGASSGLPNRQAMAKAYCAMLNFLEDKKNGVGAKEIIGYGHSIGGGVQGDALKTHELKKDVKYVFVKSRTFSNLSTTASILTNKSLGFVVKILGWNMDSVASSKKLQAPEIIMQTAKVKWYEEINDSSKIIDDGVIPANASLAKALLDDNKCPKKNKVFIGMQERHNDGLDDPSFLAQKIETLLKTDASNSDINKYFDEEAIKRYRLAAGTGDKAAMHQLAEMYLAGRVPGVEANSLTAQNKAYYWTKRAIS